MALPRSATGTERPRRSRVGVQSSVSAVKVKAARAALNRDAPGASPAEGVSAAIGAGPFPDFRFARGGGFGAQVRIKVPAGSVVPDSA